MERNLTHIKTGTAWRTGRRSKWGWGVGETLMNSYAPNSYGLYVLSFLVWPLLPTHCRCRGLLLHLITLNDTLDSTSVDEWSASRRNFYLSTYNTHKRQAPIAPVGFRPVIRTNKQPRPTGSASVFSSGNCVPLIPWYRRRRSYSLYGSWILFVFIYLFF